MTNAYLFLGTPHCGRRAILADLIRDGLSGETTVYIAEPERDAEAEKVFADVPATTLRSWKFSDASANGGNGAEIELGAPHDAGDNAVFLTDGADDPVDQIEAFAALATRLGWHVARVVTIVDCAFATAVPASAEWFAACIHFSDTVLLTRREHVSNRQINEFKAPFVKKCFPCTFELVKKDRVENPARVLDDKPRRMTMIFDERDPIDDFEFDEEHLPEEPFDLVSAPDPYLETNDSGARKISVPFIGDLLEEFRRGNGENGALDAGTTGTAENA